MRQKMQQVHRQTVLCMVGRKQGRERGAHLAMLSRCSMLLCCMCLTAALMLGSGRFMGAELARPALPGSTAATGATCMFYSQIM